MGIHLTWFRASLSAIRPNYGFCASNGYSVLIDVFVFTEILENSLHQFPGDFDGDGRGLFYFFGGLSRLRSSF